MPESGNMQPVINPAHLNEDIKTLIQRIRKLNQISENAEFKNIHIFFNAHSTDGKERFVELSQGLLPFNLAQEMQILIQQSIEHYVRQLNNYQQLLLQLQN